MSALYMQLFIPTQTNISHNYQRGNHNFETKTNLSIEVHLECIMLTGTMSCYIDLWNFYKMHLEKKSQLNFLYTQ